MRHIRSVREALKTAPSGASIKAPLLDSFYATEDGSHNYFQGENGAASPDSLTLLLLSVSKTTRALVGIKLGEIGLANGQDEMLLLLDEKTPQPVILLAEKLGIRPSTVSKTLECLVQRGLAHRGTSRSDGRTALVTITASGIVKRAKIIAMRDRLEVSLTDKIQSDDLLRLANALCSVESLLKQGLSRIR